MDERFFERPILNFPQLVLGDEMIVRAGNHGPSELTSYVQPLVARGDEKHSGHEPRFYGLGQTDSGRRLFVVFTVRDTLIRVISAREMNRRERREYEAK